MFPTDLICPKWSVLYQFVLLIYVRVLIPVVFILSVKVFSDQIRCIFNYFLKIESDYRLEYGGGYGIG